MNKFRFRQLLAWSFVLWPAMPLAAQTVMATDDFGTMGSWKPVSGRWELSADGKLCQRNAAASMAMISRPLRQYGTVTYRFELTILGGFDDQYGGFGIHVGVNGPSSGRSWGNGRSFLLWVTYDRAAYGVESFYGQLYKSEGPVTMNLLHAGKRYPVSLPGFSIGNPSAVTGKTIHVNLSIDFTTGEGSFLALTGEDRRYRFSLGGPVPAGAWVSFRTNSALVAIDDFRVTLDALEGTGADSNPESFLSFQSETGFFLVPPYLTPRKRIFPLLGARS